MSSMQIDIASLESKIFSGHGKALFVTGAVGELGIYPGHTQLLSKIKPGFIRILMDDDKEDVFYVNGGFIEVQPHMISILADTVIRAADLDEAAATEAKEKAEKHLSGLKKSDAEFEYAKATAELAEAVAQLRAIQSLRKKFKM